MRVRKGIAMFAAVGAVAVAPTAGRAAVTPIDLETYSVGTIHNQDGWSSSGAAGTGCAVYDHLVVDNSDATGYSYASLGDKSLRMSNAVVSGCFGDQTFSKPSPEAAGESTAASDGMTGPITVSHYDASWDFASTVPGSEQPGLSVVASPDRGDGARMSWIQMADLPDGLQVNFFEYVTGGVDGCAAGEFVFSTLRSALARDQVHRIQVTMDFLDGPDNDVVKVYVDGVLADPNARGYTGGSWEDYFRECEGNPTRPVDSILFRTGGFTPVPGTLGKGFLIDNLRLRTFTPTSLEAHPFIGVAIPPDVDLNVEATLLDETDNPVEGKAIDFKAGTTLMCTGTTNASGVAACAPSPEGLVAMVLQQGYVASFAGDDDYAGSSREGRLIA